MAYEFRISGAITDDEMFGFSSNQLLMHLEQANGDDLFIDIDSEGGFVDEGFSIYAKLKRYAKKNEAKITTRTDGMVASIATVIFLAGSERIVNEFMQPFIHEPWADMFPLSADEYENGANALKKEREKLATFYSKHTEMTKAKALKLMKEDTWLTAQECKEYGFADKIERLSNVNFKIVASKKNKLRKKRNEMAEKTYGAKAKKLAQSILGIDKAENKIVLDSNQNEIDFFELEEDESISVGDKARVDGESADGEYVITSPENEDETWTLVFDSGELTEINPENEGGDTEQRIDQLESEIDELKSENETLKKSEAKFKNTLKEIAEFETEEPAGGKKRQSSKTRKTKSESRFGKGLKELD